MRKTLLLLAAAWCLAPSLHAQTTLTQDADGYYQIGTPEELVAFSTLVNTVNRSANAKLTADIDMSGVEAFTPIGTYINGPDLNLIGILGIETVNSSYAGTFDGLGHVVSNVTIVATEYAEAGFFSRIWSGTVRNLGVVDLKVTNPLNIRTGAFAGFIYRSTVENCWAGGTIEFDTPFATPAGFTANANTTTLRNCWSTFEGPFTPQNVGTPQNCHSYESNPNIQADAASGALCYALNQGAGETLFYQTLDEDALPTMDASHKMVYAYGTRNCDGTTQEGSGYANEDLGFVQLEHQLGDDGFCTVCNQLPADAEGWYNIPSPRALMKFAELVNAGQNTLKGRLTQDIDLASVENFTPIGQYRDAVEGYATVNVNFRGTFDGQRHVIRNLTVKDEEYYEVGLFGRVWSGTVRNLGIVGATVEGNNANGRLGALAGFNREGLIENCFVAGELSLTSTVGGSQIGSLAGNTNNANGRFVDCWSTYEGPLTTGSGTKTRCRSIMENEHIVSDAQTGVLCYELNQGNVVNPEWRQNLGEDNCPLWGTSKGIVYMDGGAYLCLRPENESSFQDFRNVMIQNELQFVTDIVAQTALTDDFSERVEGWNELQTYEQFCSAYASLDTLKQEILASQTLYRAYAEACQAAIAYLAENEFENETRTLLEAYLTENEEPGETHANGTYPYIMETRELDSQQIQQETAYVNILLQKAISGGFVPGTEITVTIPNYDFRDELNAWTVETPSGTGTAVGGEASVMRVARGLSTPFSIGQTLTDVPDGIYMMRLNGFSRVASDIYSPFHTGSLFLNDVANYIATLPEDVVYDDQTVDGENCYLSNDAAYYGETGTGYVPASLTGASYAFRGERYVNYVAAQVTDGKLTLGVRNEGSGQENDWLVFGNLHVYYLGTPDEASTQLDQVVASYVSRAKTIQDFMSNESEYHNYPSMSAELLSQTEELIDRSTSAATGEEKMQLINDFSRLFSQIYESRMAYIAMMAATDKLLDKALLMSQAQIISVDEYSSLLTKSEEVWEAYQTGSFTAAQALQKAAEFEEMTRTMGVPQDEDGYYAISTPSHLVAFSAIVNMGNRSANARLTADIDMDGVEAFTPIGTYINHEDLAKIGITVSGITNLSYQGTFDGQGHVIRNLHVSVEDYAEAGLFSRVWSGTVRNLGLVNVSAYNSVAIRTGALAGFLYHATIENCFTTGTFQFTTEYANPSGLSPSANSSTVTNCWSTYEGPFTPENNGTRTNTYCYDNDIFIKQNAQSGALCYKLNQGAGQVIYHQTLGEGGDAYPVLDPTHGTVYLAVDQYCDGTLKGEETYSNTEGGTRDPHQLQDGICTVCNHLPLSDDGYYEITTTAALCWFSNHVNTVSNTAKGRLMRDLDMSSVENFSPIGSYRDAITGIVTQVNTNFRGIFDGARHIISNLTVNTDEYFEVGLFGRIYGGTVRNLGIVNATITSNNRSARIGALAGFNREGLIENCFSTGDIVLTCTDEAPAADRRAGLVGETNNAKGRFVNCWTTYEVGLTNNNGTKTNSYVATAEEAASGLLCYTINEGAGETVYYQTLTQDPFPVFDASHGVVLKADDDTFYNEGGDAIEVVKADNRRPATDVIYDLQGRRVAKPTRGIYIINGKKVAIK